MGYHFTAVTMTLPDGTVIPLGDARDVRFSAEPAESAAPARPIVLPGFLFVWDGPYRFTCVAKDPRLN